MTTPAAPPSTQAEAAENTRISKCSDFGSGCSCDGNLIIHEDVYDGFVKALVEQGAYLANEEEAEKLKNVMWDETGHRLPNTVAISPQKLAEAAGFTIPDDRKFIAVTGGGIENVGKEHFFSSEKLTTLLTLFKYHGEFQNALDMMQAMFNVGGKGHSCGIYSWNDDHIDRLGKAAPVSRIMVRQPNNKGNAGSATNGMPPTSSMGCGTWGGNIVSENISLKHYMNTTWVARPLPYDMPSNEELFGEFYPSGQITSHDSEDDSCLVDLGYTPQGDHVIMNRYVYEADLPILIGHTQGNPYGGYSGGYKHCATGITHWRSIASHHVPQVMHRQDFTPVSGKNLMRTKFDEIGMWMEEKMGHPFFCCDAVLDTSSRQIAVFSGYAKEMMPVSWAVADKRTYVPWAEKKYDVMVFGMPQAFHYGDGMGTNPIQMMQALSAQVIRHKRVMKDNCVIICSSICNGYFHDERWPYLRELYEMFQHDHMNILPDMDRYGEYFATNQEYIRKYRFANAFHPFHGFSMMSCGHIAEMNTSAIYIVGAQEPGIARGMGLKTRATFEEALEDAKKKFVGPNPNILALPKTFKLSAVHLCMKDLPYDGTNGLYGCGC